MPTLLDISWRCIVGRGKVQGLAVPTVENSELGVAEANRVV